MSLQDYFTQTLKKDESVVSIVRKHWISIAKPAAISLFSIGLLIGFFNFFFAAVWSIVVWFSLLALIILYAIYNWVVFFFDSIIVTDMRIIDIDQIGLFKRTVSETDLENIEDVTYTIAGVLATTLNYGSVQVQTAAAEGKIEIDKVHKPKQVQEIILEAKGLYKQRHGADMSAADLIDLISNVKGRTDIEDTDDKS